MLILFVFRIKHIFYVDVCIVYKYINKITFRAICAHDYILLVFKKNSIVKWQIVIKIIAKEMENTG